MANVALEFFMGIKDGISAELKKIGTNFEEVGHKAGKAHKEAAEGLGGIKEAAKLAQEAVEAFLGVYASTEIVNHALEAHSKLEQGLFDISKATGKVGHDLEEFKEHFEHATHGSTELTTELLKVAGTLFKVGLNSEEVGELTSKLSNNATIARISTTELTTGLTKMLLALGEAPSRIGETSDSFVALEAKSRGGGAEMLRIADILSRQLGGSVKVTSEQVLALSKVMSDIGGGRQGLIAAQTLTRQVDALGEAISSGSYKADIWAGKLGVSRAELKRMFESDPTGTVVKFNVAVANSTAPLDVQNKTLKEIGETRAQLQRSGLLVPEWQNYGKAVGEATNKTGNMIKALTLVEQYSKLYKNSVDALTKAFDSANEALGAVLAPGFKKFNDVLTEGVDSITRWFTHLSEGNKLIIADFIAYAPAVIGVAAGMRALAAAFNLLFLGNPIGLIAVGVGAVVLAWQNWNDIIEQTKNSALGTWLKSIADSLAYVRDTTISAYEANKKLLEQDNVRRGVSTGMMDSGEFVALGNTVRLQEKSLALRDRMINSGMVLSSKGVTGREGGWPFKTEGEGIGAIKPEDFANYGAGGKEAPYAKELLQIREQIKANKELASTQTNLTGEAKAVADAVTKLNEKYFDEKDKAAALKDQTIALAKAQYALSQSSQTAAAGLKDFFEKFSHDAMDQGKIVKGIMQTTMSTIEDTIIKSLDRTKVNWREFTKSILTEILKLAAIRPLLSTILGGFGFGSPNGPSTASVFGPGGFSPTAAGNVFGGGTGYSNQVVNQPTMFMFARGGQIGVMGEAGPEAVMPLKRDSAGNLGVRGTAGNVTYNPEMHFHVGGGAGGSSSNPGPSTNDMDRFGKHVDDRVRSVVLDAIHQQMRPGGMLSGVGQM